MGLLVYSVFDQESNIRTQTTGEFLARYMDEIDIVAGVLKITRLSTFLDTRPIPEDFEGDPDELKVLMSPSEEWYDAGDGAKVAASLADALSAPKPILDFRDAHPGVVAELRDLANVLKQAARKNLRFRLEFS